MCLGFSLMHVYRALGQKASAYKAKQNKASQGFFFQIPYSVVL